MINSFCIENAIYRIINYVKFLLKLITSLEM